MVERLPVQDHVWYQRDGTPIRLGDMKDSHIANCIRMLRRQVDKHDSNAAFGYGYAGPGGFGGNPDSMGAYYAEIEADREMDMALQKNLVIDLFQRELRRRHPNARIHICSDDERLPRLRL